MVNNLTFILGGARSGKSSYALRLAEATGQPVLFVATAQPFDEEMQIRIANHKAERPSHWHTLEASTKVGEAIAHFQPSAPIILIDCMTLLCSNVLLSLPQPLQLEAAEAAMRVELDSLLTQIELETAVTLIISNEVGWGIVPDNRLSRIYRDVLGRVNQRLAAYADKVVLMVAGLPHEIK